jgi:hypothetical protein
LPEANQIAHETEATSVTPALRINRARPPGLTKATVQVIKSVVIDIYLKRPDPHEALRN